MGVFVRCLMCVTKWFFWDSAQIATVVDLCSCVPVRRLRRQDGGKALVMPIFRFGANFWFLCVFHL